MPESPLSSSDLEQFMVQYGVQAELLRLTPQELQRVSQGELADPGLDQAEVS